MVHWQHASGGHVPHEHGKPVKGGKDLNGQKMFVARAQHHGDLIPGKLSHDVCYVSHSGHEHKHTTYEVLMKDSHSKGKWKDSSHGHVPHGAILGGHQSDGTPLYIGRVKHHGAEIIGKVHPGHHCLYVPWDGKEERYEQYEILVEKHD